MKAAIVLPLVIAGVAADTISDYVNAIPDCSHDAFTKACENHSCDTSSVGKSTWDCICSDSNLGTIAYDTGSGITGQNAVTCAQDFGYDFGAACGLYLIDGTSTAGFSDANNALANIFGGSSDSTSSDNSDNNNSSSSSDNSDNNSSSSSSHRTSKKKGISGGAIAGIVIGVLALVVIVAGAALFFCLRNRRAKAAAVNNDVPANQTTYPPPMEQPPMQQNADPSLSGAGTALSQQSPYQYQNTISSQHTGGQYSNEANPVSAQNTGMSQQYGYNSGGQWQNNPQYNQAPPQQVGGQQPPIQQGIPKTHQEVHGNSLPPQEMA